MFPSSYIDSIKRKLPLRRQSRPYPPMATVCQTMNLRDKVDHDKWSKDRPITFHGSWLDSDTTLLDVVSLPVARCVPSAIPAAID